MGTDMEASEHLSPSAQSIADHLKKLSEHNESEEKIPKEEKDTLTLSDEEKEKLRQLSQMSMWLDGYDDIFSDFDSRGYSKRTLSDDFLNEVRKEAKETASGKVELSFLIPAEKRDIPHEAIIKKRLHDFFKHQYALHHSQRKQLIRKGYAFILLGFLSMLLATYILFNFTEDAFLTHFLAIVFEPAGWFFFWEGLAMLLFDSKEKKPDLEFFGKMHGCTITFSSY